MRKAPPLEAPVLDAVVAGTHRLGPDAGLMAVAEELAKAGGAVLTLDAAGEPAGVLTAEALLDAALLDPALAASEPAAALILRAQRALPTALPPDASVREAITTLLRDETPYVAVRSEENGLQLLCVHDLLRFVGETTPEFVLNVDPDPTVPMNKREGE